MKNIILFLFVFQAFFATAQENMMPQPAQVLKKEGKFRLKKDFKLSINGIFPKNWAKMLLVSYEDSTREQDYFLAKK